ncbi:hypothetical protein LCL96_07575 [Rossellomorea aquimaris]|uniref:hypothetical protein n=1 Tax=Rossellomorea TaxID=2837508 RepID=UPI001CD2B12F|nr:hypothetical protein [Rossellomorea aquimaris]MCA1058788.1 hypothetical protein [Rossellomorea aquimaris]
MKDQMFIDVEVEKDESLSDLLQEIVTEKREELGTHSVYVHQVIPTYPNGFTIILEIHQSVY